MFRLLEYLQAANELVEDKAELRMLGLTEEELDGYEEFFFENYFPRTKNEQERKRLD